METSETCIYGMSTGTSMLHSFTDCNTGPFSAKTEKVRQKIQLERRYTHTEFIVRSLNYLVGLGNVWRFPFLCYKYGGGAFLAVYLICLLFVGIPISILESTLGQFSSKGLLNSYDIMPPFRGLSVTYFILSFTTSYYYNTIIAWAMDFLFLSLHDMPWKSCGNWSSALCEGKLHEINNETCLSEPTLRLYANGTCYNETSNTLFGIADKRLALMNDITPRMIAEDYFRVQISDHPDSQSHMGKLRFDLILFLFLSWSLVCSILTAKGKTALLFLKFSIIFPITQLVFLQIFSMMQTGSEDGIQLYMKTDLKYILNMKVWKDALFQVILSISMCMGGHIILGSRKRFHYNVVKDVLFLCIVDLLISIYAGFAVFAFIGGLARSRGVHVETLTKSGLALVFIIFPQACVGFPGSALWSSMFFLMLILLGIGSLLTMVSTAIEFILECLTFITPKRQSKKRVSICVCVIFFLLSLSMANNSGYRIVQEVDSFAFSWNAVAIILCNCIIVVLYHPERLENDLKVMLTTFGEENQTVSKYWYIIKFWCVPCWCMFCPLILIVIFFGSAVRAKIEFNDSLLVFVLYQLASLMPVAISNLYCFSKSSGSWEQRLSKVYTPSSNWGPYLLQHRRLIQHVPNFIVNPRGLPDIRSSTLWPETRKEDSHLGIKERIRLLVSIKSHEQSL